MASTTHEYPGVSLPLHYLRQDGRVGLDFYRLGSFEGAEGSLSELIQVREVFMMILMDRLTDKPDWHEKVFDENIVAKWRTEALTQPEAVIYRQIIGGKSVPRPRRTRIMSEKAFDYCISELRCKAEHFKKTGLVFTLNSPQGLGDNWYHNTAIKSDSIVSSELQQGLKAAFEKLHREQAAEPDWHPGSNEMVQDLVHPSMYPFVYDQTKFIQDEVVGVADAVDKWSGKGDVVPTPDNPEPGYGVDWSWENGDGINREYWSQTYQWLPANLAFQDDGTVRFTSYINNLHPNKHPGIYKLIEQLIDKAIPAWDRVLSSRAALESGQDQRRFDLPPEVSEKNRHAVWEKFNPEVLAEHEARTGPVGYELEDVDYLSDDEVEQQMSDEAAKKARKAQRLKWNRIRDPLLPEPRTFEPVTYKVKRDMRKKFKDTGLQVIVKMASIELTPEKPDFPVGGWHIEGQMNEHIVATALYYLDSENVTPSSLSFRMATSQEQEHLQERVGQDLYRVYERIYGTELGISYSPDGGANVQNYGNVATPEGRLLAFPNIFQHRVSSFRLQDRTRPGHRRFIALWLVDPLTRIISTANVPPQQFDWWAEAVFGTEDKAARGEFPQELFQLLLEQGADKTIKPSEDLLKSMSNRLPPEVMDMVRHHRAVPEGLMTVEEARQHRLKLMEERSAFVEKAGEEWSHSYSFCEH